MFPIIDTNTNYYLIKTNNGYYYQIYKEKRIISLYSINVSFVNNSLIINKLHKKKDLQLFIYELKIGDFVLIPSYRHQLICIGKVISNYFIENNKIYRRVKWLKTINLNELVLLNKYLHLPHNIININDLNNVIDRNIYSYYEKNNLYHIILKVKQKENILCKSLYGLYDLLLNEIDYQKLQIKVINDNIKITNYDYEKITNFGKFIIK